MKLKQLALLFASSATLLGCARWPAGWFGYGTIGKGAVSTIDDRDALAIETARRNPDVDRYLKSHPLYPFWSVYHDEFYPVGGTETFEYRSYYCNNEYVVDVIGIPKNGPSAEPGELDATVLVDIVSGMSRSLPYDEEFATPVPAPTPCLDGARPWPYGEGNSKLVPTPATR